MILEILVAIASIIAISIILYFRWNYGTLEKLGIPVVKPHFLWGSQNDIHQIVGHERDYEWFQTYGEIYGVYSGREPQIHVVDPEIIRQVFIKDFDKFVNRSLDFSNGSPLFAEMLDLIKDEKWKTVRSALSPIYTTAKLKRMTEHMTGATDDLLGLLKEDVESAPNGVLENCNIYQEVSSIAMDMAARCTLNIKIKDPRSPDNDITKGLRELTPETPSFIMKIFLLFSEVTGLPQLFPKKSPEGFFVKIFQQVMAERRNSKEANDDFIDLLNIMVDKTKTEEYKKLNISEITILAQGVAFFVAGIDGIATALHAMILYTSQNPEIAEKLYEEVDAYFVRNKGIVTHENLGECKYLNACLYEALRLHPFFTRNDRRCNEDVEYKGLKIKKGMTVAVPLWPYNRNPKYFPDPHTFDPERFMPHNKNNIDMFTFGTFGNGPRMCIGMRFAFECMLIMGVKLFQNFNFTTKPGAKVEYFNTIFPGVSPVNPTQFNVSKRRLAN